MVEKSTKTPRRSSRKTDAGEGTSEAARPTRRAASGARAAEAAPEVERTVQVAVAAYYRAERRGFAPGRELEDWLTAESELEAQRPRSNALRATPNGGPAS